MFDQDMIETINKTLFKKTISVAETATAGILQTAFSQGTYASH